MSSRLQRVRVMKIFVELFPEGWTELGVCLSSGPLITLPLAVPRVPALMVEIAVAQACLQVSVMLFVS